MRVIIMKKIIAAIIALPIAFLIVVNVDKVSHPSEVVGVWKNNTTRSYTFNSLGTGTFDPGKEGESSKTISWYVKDGLLCINQFPDYYYLELKEGSFKHTGYKEQYQTFEKVGEAKSAESIWGKAISLLFNLGGDNTSGKSLESNLSGTEIQEMDTSDILSVFGINSQQTENYLNVTGNYKRYIKSSKFDVYYPSKLFNNVQEISNYKDYKEASNTEGILFSGESGSTLTYAKASCASDQKASDYLNTISSDLLIENVLSDTEDSVGRCLVITGYTTSAQKEIFYILLRSYGTDVYIMDARFPGFEDAVDQQRKNYYAECIYRGAGFSNTSKSLRSYADYIEESGILDEEFSAAMDIKSVNEAEKVEW